MTARISPENERFLAEQVARGAYPDCDRAVDAAIALLREQAAVLERIDRGRVQLDGADCNEYDEESLAARFESLKTRAAECAAKISGQA